MESGKKIFDINTSGTSPFSLDQFLPHDRSRLSTIFEQDEAAALLTENTNASNNLVQQVRNNPNFSRSREPSNTQPDQEQPMAILDRLENEDVTDPNSSIISFGSVYNEVIDEELCNFFKDYFESSGKMYYTSNTFAYIYKDNRIFRKSIRKAYADLKTKETVDKLLADNTNEDSAIDQISKQLQNQSLNGARSKVNTDESNANLKKPTSQIVPPNDWTSNIYSDMSPFPKVDYLKRIENDQTKKSIFSSREDSDNDKSDNVETGFFTKKLKAKRLAAAASNRENYIEASNLNPLGTGAKNVSKTVKNPDTFKLLSKASLDKMEGEINELKKKEFLDRREKYVNGCNTYMVSNSQYLISKNVFDLELQKPERDQDQVFIASHIALRSSLNDQKCKLKVLEDEITNLAKRKSPYYLGEIQMPVFGTKDTFDTDAVKLFPLVGSDEDISIKDLFEWLSSWAEGIGLSEKGLKMAIFSRLRGTRANAWLQYQKQPLKEAITSMSLLFDKTDSPLKFANQIKDFRRLEKEEIQNSVERLIRSINKYLENKNEHDKKVLRLEHIKSKIDKLLSPRAQREIFKLIEEKNQLGEEISERELISSIYKEDTFDRRAEANQNIVSLQNIQVDKTSNDNDSLHEDSENLELNAAEKRSHPADSRNDFKHARTHDRKILNPVRKYGSNPIVIGHNQKPLIRVNNPNPNNRWHPQNTYQDDRLNKGRPNYNDRNSNSRNTANDRRDFLRSRSAPLQQQQQRYQSSFKPQMRYSRDIEFDRRYQSNDYNDVRPKYQYYDSNGFKGNKVNQRYNNGFNPNKGNLRFGQQFRTNPPAIFQQITLEELNSMCVSCPKDQAQHTVANCPRSKVFRRAPNHTMKP